MKGLLCLAIACGALTLAGVSRAGESTPAPYDAALANRLGADARGMRPYVLVILKTGPKHVPEGKARDAMFAGHFANIQRLADAGKLVTAGPFDDAGGDWRGLFLFAVESVDQAMALVATDPVIAHGEMVAEYHRWYGSAAAMMLPQIHRSLTAPVPGSTAH
ncbi:YciI family protein [Dyella sp.]|jgi:uncharacterized protein YciI|uniref:YciI family protein n=1 Tax=Dyella sp. TaxID=1869338 RepID=UPI002D784FAC|nr:YciI family protein [Dyella sp.]HET6432472.1 YciI family protein [Dyella sp.]